VRSVEERKESQRWFEGQEMYDSVTSDEISRLTMDMEELWTDLEVSAEIRYGEGGDRAYRLVPFL